MDQVTAGCVDESRVCGVLSGVDVEEADGAEDEAEDHKGD